MSNFWKVFRIRPTVKMEVPFLCAGFWLSSVRMGVPASSRLRSSASIELGEPSAPHMGRPAKTSGCGMCWKRKPICQCYKPSRPIVFCRIYPTVDREERHLQVLNFFFFMKQFSVYNSRTKPPHSEGEELLLRCRQHTRPLASCLPCGYLEKRERKGVDCDREIAHWSLN